MVSRHVTAEPDANWRDAKVDPSRSFYFWLSLGMWAIAITGFAPGAVSGLLSGTFVESRAVHVHAIVYVAWLALFSCQASLPASRQTDLHR